MTDLGASARLGAALAMVVILILAFRAHCQSNSIIHHLALLDSGVNDTSLRDTIDGADLIGSLRPVCFRDVVHGRRKAWCGLA